MNEDEDHLEHLEDHHHNVRFGEVAGPAVAASGVKYCQLVTERLGHGIFNSYSFFLHGGLAGQVYN